MVSNERHGMNNNSSFSDDTNSQFALSYELLHLLQWIGKNDTDKLKKLIAKAIQAGLHDEIQKINQSPTPHLLQEIHANMIHFFDILDELLFNAINEHVKKKAQTKNLFPTIDFIDGVVCNRTMIRYTIEETLKKLNTHGNTNPQEQLYKELLKQWKPVHKNYIN